MQTVNGTLQICFHYKKQTLSYVSQSFIGLKLQQKEQEKNGL